MPKHYANPSPLETNSYEFDSIPLEDNVSQDKRLLWVGTLALASLIGVTVAVIVTFAVTTDNNGFDHNSPEYALYKNSRFKDCYDSHSPVANNCTAIKSVLRSPLDFYLHAQNITYLKYVEIYNSTSFRRVVTLGATYYPTYDCLASQIPTAPGTSTCSPSQICSRDSLFYAYPIEFFSDSSHAEPNALIPFILLSATFLFGVASYFVTCWILPVFCAGSFKENRKMAREHHFGSYFLICGLSFFSIALMVLASIYAMKAAQRGRETGVSVDWDCEAVHVTLSPWRFYFDVQYQLPIRLAQMWFNVLSQDSLSAYLDLIRKSVSSLCAVEPDSEGSMRALSIDAAQQRRNYRFDGNENARCAIEERDEKGGEEGSVHTGYDDGGDDEDEDTTATPTCTNITPTTGT
ncbi:hypothetical protein V499_00988 [Pseudogymnoascus sp. VKM F-103]|nr:hypothetical protein V499_00988 [Pseudogymnoascus sp. VKM F-103]